MAEPLSRLIIICSDGRVIERPTTGDINDIYTEMDYVSYIYDCRIIGMLISPPSTGGSVKVKIVGRGKVKLIGPSYYEIDAPGELEVEEGYYVIVKDGKYIRTEGIFEEKEIHV